MVKNKITVYHVYQDKHNPTKQIITENADYGTRFALFMALIERGIDFKVEITGDEEK